MPPETYEADDAPAAQPQAATPPKTDDEYQVDPQEAALVKSWLERVRRAYAHWEPAFKRMREDQDYARYGASKEWLKSNSYYVPIVPRMIALAVAGLYARNPKFVTEPTKRLTLAPPLDDPAAVQAAMATPNDPVSMQIQDALIQARQQSVALRRFAQTVELLADHYIRKARPLFKRQMKALVRRAKTTGVGYLMLDFQRSYVPRPEITQQVQDNSEAMSRLVFLKDQVAEGEDSSDIDKQMAEATMLQESLQNDPGQIADEGPVFDFPKSNAVIPDEMCVSLDGFVGSDFIAIEYNWPCDKVEQQFGVKLQKGEYEGDGSGGGKIIKPSGGDANGDEKKNANVKFYQVQDRISRTVFFISPDHCGFLRAPQPPAVKLDRFWTVFSLVFNETDHEEEIFPVSDVNALKPTQTEYNSARQSLSDHRIANAPRFMAAKGAFSPEDKKAITDAVPFSVTEVTPPLSGKIGDSLEAMKQAPIDPNLYDTEHLFTDALRMTGAQQANFGPTTGASATESSIADQTRTVDISSQQDDLDDFLSEFGNCLGEALMANVSEQTVIDIVGPGAVWSQFAMPELQKQIFLTTKAGSNGRPNRAAELANLEKAMVWLQQMPGISEEPIIRKGADLLDIDYDELYLASAPSIAARNAAANGLGDGGANDPRAQAGQGANTVPRGSQEPTTHQTFPAPASGAAG
jgi:hypothetical protein